MSSIQLHLALHPTSSTDYLLTEVWIDDDIPLVNFRDYAIDLGELQRSIGSDGAFWVVTCWCGNAGCAGIQRPVKVVQEADAVHWYIEEPEPLHHVVFPRSAYETAIWDVLERCRHWLPQQPYIGGKSLEITPVQNARFFDCVPPTG